ncbi:MAG: DNA-3-methyladenine glycosylase I, partial [Actinobacteria bacterium]|nr:DNA-3-methyladenine glycosylase I [Actinomycetota bacterium]
MELVTGADGLDRCRWGAAPQIYRAYHDEEWGRAVTADHRLFEKICLEGFQAGLSWLTILRKREAFRDAFAGFDPEVVAGFGEGDVSRLLANPRIVRHQGKIRS